LDIDFVVFKNKEEKSIETFCTVYNCEFVVSLRIISCYVFNCLL